jgi:hypothetical protein
LRAAEIVDLQMRARQLAMRGPQTHDARAGRRAASTPEKESSNTMQLRGAAESSSAARR